MKTPQIDEAALEAAKKSFYDVDMPKCPYEEIEVRLISAITAYLSSTIVNQPPNKEKTENVSYKKVFAKGAEWMRSKILDIPDIIYCPPNFIDEIQAIPLTDDEVKE